MATAKKAAKKKRTRIRISPPGKRPAFPGERRVHMVRLPQKVWDDVEALGNWKKHPSAPFDTMGAVYDHALQWFINNPARSGYDEYHSALSQTKKDTSARSFWINSAIYQLATSIAERDGVPINRVLHTAVVLFIREQAKNEAAKPARK